MPDLGRTLMLLGGTLFAVGLLFALFGRTPGLGQLPGDLRFQRDGVTVFIPIGTMIVLSIALTVVLNLIARLWR